jgi:hypothetical protein
MYLDDSLNPPGYTVALGALVLQDDLLGPVKVAQWRCRRPMRSAMTAPRHSRQGIILHGLETLVESLDSSWSKIIEKSPNTISFVNFRALL